MPERRMVVKLKATSAVTDLIGTGDNARIYPIGRYQGTALPAITYQRVATTPINHSTGQVDTEFCTVQVNCFGATYTAAKGLAAAVATALKGWTDDTESPDIGMCHKHGESDLPQVTPQGQEGPDVEAVTMDFFIQYT